MTHTAVFIANPFVIFVTDGVHCRDVGRTAEAEARFMCRAERWRETIKNYDQNSNKVTI